MTTHEKRIEELQKVYSDTRNPFYRKLVKQTIDVMREWGEDVEVSLKGRKEFAVVAQYFIDTNFNTNRINKIVVAYNRSYKMFYSTGRHMARFSNWLIKNIADNPTATEQDFIMSNETHVSKSKRQSFKKEKRYE